MEIRCGFDCGDFLSFRALIVDADGGMLALLLAESWAIRCAVSGVMVPDRLRCARLVSRAIRLAAVSRAKLGTLSIREENGDVADCATVLSGRMLW